MDERAKTELAEQLFRHLSDNLDPSVKAGISSIQMRDILHSVVEWIYSSKHLEKTLNDAKVLAQPKSITPKVELHGDDFEAELLKL